MFTTRAKLSVHGKNKWVLLEAFRFITTCGVVIQVPKGFVCDLASIPRVLRLLIQVNGAHREAAIIHDWLYYKRGHVAFRQFTREECDAIFYEAMLVSGVSPWKAWTMWAGVRVGGWVAWRR